MAAQPNCKFCQIAAKELSSVVVFEDELSLAFLDTRPLFPGHTLLIPRRHYETLSDLPSEATGPFFQNVKRLAHAIELGMQAEGSFVAINNRVSQSVPHLHVHIVPRRKKDGLRGFFWPRSTYKDETQMKEIQQAIQKKL